MYNRHKGSLIYIVPVCLQIPIGNSFVHSKQKFQVEYQVSLKPD